MPLTANERLFGAIVFISSSRRYGDDDLRLAVDLTARANLVGNAIKFTPRGGRITIGAAAEDGEVVFRVADTGQGMFEAQLRHLFDRFWQGDRKDRRGAGLGLAIAKGIVEAHGGRIWVESVQGAGTTLYFSIPTA